MATTEELLFILQMQDQASSVMAGFSRTITTTATAAKEAKGGLSELNSAIAGVGIAFGALAANEGILKKTVGTFREYELGIANIQKTTGISGAAVADFSTKFDDLARSMPVPIAKLQEIAYQAGSLGVQGTENVLAVTKAVAELGTTTNLSGEKAILALVQLLNVMHEAPTEAGRLASQIVNMDNVTAASASSIANMAREIGLATSVFHIGSGAAVAIGAAMADAGIRAERGGTAVGRVFTALDQATRGTLPKGLADLSALFGKTTAQLREMETADPTAFFEAFMKKLHDVEANGGNYYILLKDLGLGQRETASSIVPLADRYEQLARNLNRVAVEAKYTVSQSREFEIFLQTLDSKIKIANTSLELFEKDIGKAFASSAKGGVDAFNSSINSLDSGFKSLSPQVQTFITTEGLALAAVLTFSTAIQALNSLMTVLGVTLLSNPWVLAAAAIATVTAAVLAYNSNVSETIELTQQEAVKLQMLTSGTDDAKVAMEGLTRAEGENIKLALEAKIADTTAKMIDLSREIRTGQTAVEFFMKSLIGLGTDGTQQFEKLYQMMDQGVISSDEYKKVLQQVVAENGPLADQARRILALQTQWDSATKALSTYTGTLNKIGDTSALPDSKPKATPAATSPTPASFAGSTPKAKSTGNHDQEVADFLRETQIKEDGYARETAALNISTEAYTRQQKVERENAEVEQVMKRALDLHISGVNELTAAYRQSLEARDAAQNKAAANDEVKTVQEQIDAMNKEATALRAGSKAYEEYKRASKIDPQIEAFQKKLEALGMEKSAVDALTASYKAAAANKEQAEQQAEQEKATQKDLADAAKEVGKAAMDSANAMLFQGKSFKQAAASFEQSVAKMIEQKLIFAPLEKMFSNLADSMFGVPINGGGSGGAGGGGGIMSGVGGAIGGIAKWLGFTGVGGAGAGGAGAAAGVAGGASDAETAAAFSDDGVQSAAAVLHKGGVVGSTAEMRTVNNSIFNMAPRYHTGLGSDEFAAILQRGERVLTSNQNSRMQDTVNGLANQVAKAQAANTGAAATAVHFNITTPSADSFVRSQSQIYSKAASAMAMANRRS